MIRNNLRDKAKLIEENSSSYINNLNAPAHLTDNHPLRNMTIQNPYNADQQACHTTQYSAASNFEIMSSKSFVSNGG